MKIYLLDWWWRSLDLIASRQLDGADCRVASLWLPLQSLGEVVVLLLSRKFVGNDYRLHKFWHITTAAAPAARTALTSVNICFDLNFVSALHNAAMARRRKLIGCEIYWDHDAHF